MTREDLTERLDGELAAWRAKPFEEVSRLSYPLVYEKGEKGRPDYYSTEVLVLERSENRIHLSISVDDGRLSAFVPVSGSILVSPGAHVPTSRERRPSK